MTTSRDLAASMVYVMRTKLREAEHDHRAHGTEATGSRLWTMQLAYTSALEDHFACVEAQALRPSGVTRVA